MPGRSTTNAWPFPSNTREVPFDEKWPFVGKKEKHCDPADPDDAKRGDNWDHVAPDPEHRLVVSVVSGKRTVANVEALVRDFKERTEDRPMHLITSKDWYIHDAVTYFTRYTCNFCWPVRTLRQRGPDGQWLRHTPAMAAGLTDHVWSPWEWLTSPAVQRE